jgi:hypothetical protein
VPERVGTSGADSLHLYNLGARFEPRDFRTRRRRRHGAHELANRGEMSAKTLVAPPAGNRRAERHGFYVRQLRPLECDEVSEIADAIRALAPLDADGLEPAIQLLAGQIWRRKRAYADLHRHGVTRGRADRSRAASILTDLTKLEGSILDGLRELGMTARSAAALGLELKRLERFRDWDFSRLTRAEKATFDELVAKASTYRDGDDAAA